MNKIVVTGIGLALPEVDTIDDFWACVTGNGIDFKATSIDTEPIPSKIGGEIQSIKSMKEDRIYLQANKYCQLSAVAAERALEDSRLVNTNSNISKTGIIGATTIGFPSIDQLGSVCSPTKSQFMHYHSAVGLICLRHKLTGPTWSVTSGETSGMMAVTNGLELIRSKKCNSVLVGAADILSRTACLHYFSLKTLSLNQLDKHECILPFGKNRNGFLLTESSVYLVLEDYEHACNRGAKIYGEILNYGTAQNLNIDDSSKITFNTFLDSINETISESNVNLSDINLFLSSANGSEHLDRAEADLICNLQKQNSDLLTCNIKSAVGETMSTSGLLNIVTALLSYKNRGEVPPLLHKDKIGYDINIVRNLQQIDHKLTLCSSAGHSGNYVSLLTGPIL